MSGTSNAGGTPFEGPAGRLLDGRHPVRLSVALHLLPGVLIVAAYVLLGIPVAEALRYPSVFGFLVVIPFVLVPVELGLLLYLGWKRNGRASLVGVVLYRGRPMRRGALAALVVALLAWSFVVGAVLSLLDSYIFREFFSWLPERFFIGVGPGEYLTDYARAAAVVTLLASLVLSGFVLPAVEELYFRGYLLPRLSYLGAWAPVLNMTLFALYHLWTPWQALSRIFFFLPTVWATWRREDLRIALWVHCLANTMGVVLTLAAVLAGVSP